MSPTADGSPGPARARRLALLRRLAIGLALLGFVLGAAQVAFSMLGDQPINVEFFLYLVQPTVYVVVGGLLAARLPENRIGWMCLAVGLLFIAGGVAFPLGIWIAGEGHVSVASWVIMLGSLWVPALGIIGTHLPLRLPDGELPSPAWRWYSRACTFVVALFFALVLMLPLTDVWIPGLTNPLAVDGVASLGSLFPIIPAIFVGSFLVLALRFRRSRGVERQQMRVIAVGGFVFMVFYLPTILPALGIIRDDLAIYATVETIGHVTFAAFPVAIGIAVLRYRLYDIDVIVNRTLVYGGLTATLAATYLGSVLLLQFVLSGVTADSSLAVAGSTLAVAALFQPARARIQSAVDRRFFRRKYDAARTLERFGGRLRDEVDLDALAGELRAVVGETMQPAHVSLWLRDAEVSR